MDKNRPQIFFSDEWGYFDQKLPAESNKNGPDALQIQLLVGIGSFCCEKSRKKVIFENKLIFSCDDGDSGGIDGVGSGSDGGCGGSVGGGGGDSSGGSNGSGESGGGGISGSDIILITSIWWTRFFNTYQM